MVSQSEGNFDGIRTKKFVGGETLEPEKRLEFIIDWCPLGSASRSVVEIRRIQHRNEIARAGVEKIFHRHFPNCSVEFEFAFRDDGLMILAIQVPERTPFASLRHAAREILDEIKANALDHIHHHHHHRFKAMIESGRNTHWRSIKDFLWNEFGSQFKLAHDVVRISFPSSMIEEAETLQEKTDGYLRLEENDRILELYSAIESNELVKELSAPSRFGYVSALHMLDRFIAKKHDEAIRFHDYMQKSHRKRLASILIICCLFTVLMSACMVAAIGFTEYSGSTIAYVSAVLSSTLVGFLIYNSYDLSLGAKDVIAIRSKTGYLSRSSDFAALLSEVYADDKDKDMRHASPHGYDSLVRSLDVLLEGLNNSTDARRLRNSQILVGIGTILTVIITLGVGLNA